MERTRPETGEGSTLRLKTGDRRDGLLGALGMAARVEVDAWLCPECGRVDLYADLDD